MTDDLQIKASSIPEVTIFTDGACSGNPGPGGWAVLLRCGSTEKELQGSEEETTNNRMELLAVIHGLEALKKSTVVQIYTDSQYVKNGITQWIHAWQKNNWRTAQKKPVKNQDLWQRLLKACQQHRLHWHWVRGHSGHTENTRVDILARQAITKSS